MLMMTGKLGETGTKASTRSLKSLMIRASVLLLMATGTACFPGATAEELGEAVATCDISALDQLDLTEEERNVILGRCNDAQDRNYDQGTGIQFDDAGRPINDDEHQFEHNDDSVEHRMVDMSNLDSFEGEWVFEDDRGVVRNTEQVKGGVLIAQGSNFSDLKMRVLLNPISQDLDTRQTEMGLVFRAYEVSPGRGEGYFAIVDVEAQELRVGFHYADGTNEILDSRSAPIETNTFRELRVEVQGHDIYVSYGGTELRLFDDRSRNGAVGLLVTRGIGEFTEFFAEGIVERGTSFGQNDYEDCNVENDNNETCDYHPDYNQEHSSLGSLRTHEGEWFNDGEISGNIERDEDSLQITSREFENIYLYTRMLTQTENTKMGLIFRATLDEDGNSTGYFTGLNAEDNQLVLGYHHANGENQILASAYMDIKVGEFYDIDVEAMGSHIRVYCNNVSLELESDLSSWGVAGLIATDGLAVFTEFEAKEIYN
jgi:hypothetical protein